MQKQYMRSCCVADDNQEHRAQFGPEVLLMLLTPAEDSAFSQNKNSGINSACADQVEQWIRYIPLTVCKG